MEKITKKKIQYIAKPTEVEVISYMTEDGKEFITEEEATRHEEYLQIEKAEFRNKFEIDGTWYNFKNSKELYSVIWDETVLDNEEKFENIEYPIWLLLQVNYAYSDQGVQYVYELEEIKNILENAILDLPNTL